jgi:hypothetical protein
MNFVLKYVGLYFLANIAVLFNGYSSKLTVLHR